MAELRKNDDLLRVDFGRMFAYPSVLQSLHWIKKGAPPGI